LNAAFRRRVSATKLFKKPPLAFLNGTSNPIGLHNEHSLFQRISINLHYDVKESKQAPRISPHVWLTTRAASSWLSLSYLILSFRVTNFLFANSQNTQPHFITGMTSKCIVLLFFLWTNIFWGYPRVGRTVQLIPLLPRYEVWMSRKGNASMRVMVRSRAQL
jgi:hypothetical protein